VINILVILGESASGKSTVEKELVKYGFIKTVSYTTRSPRDGEIDGIDYYFISDSEFETRRNNGDFCEIGKYNGWNYATAIEDCTDDKVVVLTPHGLRQMKRYKDLDIISFYIDVPRRDRLIKILQRKDDIEEAYRRSLSDVGMFDGIKDEVDFVIHNDGYSKTPCEIAIEIIETVENIKKAKESINE
jgi:guanylate kinase